MKYRVGYSYNSNPMNHSVGSSLDGIPAVSDFIQLYQASSARSSIRIASPAASDGNPAGQQRASHSQQGPSS